MSNELPQIERQHGRPSAVKVGITVVMGFLLIIPTFYFAWVFADGQLKPFALSCVLILASISCGYVSRHSDFAN
jgi:hypothetical protein